MFKVYNRNTTTMSEICSKSKIQTPCTNVSIVNFEQVNAGWIHNTVNIWIMKSLQGKPLPYTDHHLNKGICKNRITDAALNRASYYAQNKKIIPVVFLKLGFTPWKAQQPLEECNYKKMKYKKIKAYRTSS